MSSVKGKLARRAAKTTAKHTAHGATSKLKRSPLRAATLLGIGAALGLALGWVLFRKSDGSEGTPPGSSLPASEQG